MARLPLLFGLGLVLASSPALVWTTSAAAFPGESDLVSSLPGLAYKPTYKHYSGYLEGENGIFLHYWFFESQSPNPSKDPVALWLNGGPGCSSMLGALTELGPIRLHPNGTLSENPYAWNQKVNLLFLESPAGVGFSYKADRIYAQTDESTAILNYNALKSFYSKFPQLSDNDFYITGESYGGVYIPTLSMELLRHQFPKNFKGVAIGNGALDLTQVGNSVVHFAYNHGLVDTVEWETQLKACCPTSSPWSLRSCDFQELSNEKCQALHVNFISTLLKMMINGINVYNIYGNCEVPSNLTQGSSSQQSSSHGARQALLFDALSLDANDKIFKSIANISGTTPPCTNEDHLISYLARPSVREALHISPSAFRWFPCRKPDDIGYRKTVPSVKSHVKHMLDAGLKVLIYNGDVDLICNYLGSQWFVEGLGYPTSKPYHPWLVNGQVAGFAKYFLANHQLALLTIRGAGHMVPGDKPEEAREMFNHFVKGF